MKKSKNKQNSLIIPNVEASLVTLRDAARNVVFLRRSSSGSRPKCSFSSQKLFGVPKNFFKRHCTRERNPSRDTAFERELLKKILHSGKD